jgi:uncharacterized protein YhjY with autotransporter beta-barrel domain
MNIVLQRFILCASSVLAVASVQAQTPGGALDAAWIAACASATPGTPFFQRCQEILNAGPGSGDRRSEAALGNNLNTVAGQGRVASSSTGDAGRIDWGRGGLFFGFSTRDLDRDADAQEAGFDGAALSAILGIDRRFGDRHVLGIALNHQRERADYAGGAGRSSTRHLGLIATYGGGFGEHWTLDAYAGALRGSLDVVRRVQYSLVLNAGTPAQSTASVQALAEAATDTRRDVAGIGLGYLLDAGPVSWQFGGGYDIARSRFDAYVERGAAGLELAVGKRSLSSQLGRVGVRATRTASTAFGVLQPYVGIEAFHEFANDARTLQVAFAGDAARTPIRFGSAAPDRDWMEASVGVAATLVGGSSAFVEYRQRFAHAFLDERALSFGLRVEFD